MSLTSEQMQELIACGVTAEQLVVMVRIIEEKQSIIDAAREKARDRKRKQRDMSRDSHGTVTGQSGDTAGTPPSSPLALPQMVSPITPSLTPSLIPPSPQNNSAGTRIFVLPDWLPESDWQDYLEMRAKIRKPATRRAMELAVAKLERLRKSGNDPGLVLQQSVMGAYQGLFELKQEHTNGKSGISEHRGGTSGHRQPTKAERTEAALRKWADESGLTAELEQQRGG